MNKQKKQIFKIGLSILASVLLIICVLEINVGTPSKQETIPTSRMLSSTSDILYDADNIAKVNSANIGQEKGTSTEKEKQKREEENKKNHDEINKNEENSKNSSQDIKDVEGDNQAEQSEQWTHGREQRDTPSGDEDQIGSGETGKENQTSSASSDLGDLIDIGGSGSQGGQVPNRRPSTTDGDASVEDPERYFETSIVDGDIIDYKNYTFTIHHLKPLLQVKGISVRVNDKEYSFRASSKHMAIKLKEGANKIDVTVMYFDGKEYIDAVRTYTVNYTSGGKTIIVAYSEENHIALEEMKTTSSGDFTFVAYGLKGDKKLRAHVRVNGKTVKSSGSKFTADLKFGKNKIEITAGGRQDSVTETFEIKYRVEKFCIVNDFSDTIIDNSTKQPDYITEEFPVYLNDENFRFSFSLNQETGKEKIVQVRYDDNLLKKGKDGFYTAKLDTRHPKKLRLTYTDSEGNQYRYKWLIRFHRNADATPKDRCPTIYANVELNGRVMGLSDGMTFKNPDIITIVDARSWNNQQLYPGDYKVYINDHILSTVSQTDARFGFNTYLSNIGANKIKIIATDKDGYTVTREWTVYYEKGDVTFTVSIEATTVGLGYLIRPTKVTVPGGTDVMTVIRDLLQEKGYKPVINNGYLASIGKEGICRGFSIPIELKKILIDDGMDTTDAGMDPSPNDINSLGEFDFYRWSGWMYSHNGVYPGYGMSQCKPQDGSVIRLRYTLALGKDIGGFSSAIGSGYGNTTGNYYREW